MAVNIPGNDVCKGEVWSEYVGPDPPKNSGLHRYVILGKKKASNNMEPIVLGCTWVHTKLQLGQHVCNVTLYALPVFKQPGRIHPEEAKQGLSQKGRGGTSARKFAAKYGLGDPVAGNFFLAKWERTASSFAKWER